MSDETACESENPLDHIGDQVPDLFEHPAENDDEDQAVSGDA